MRAKGVASDVNKIRGTVDKTPRCINIQDGKKARERV